MSWQETIFDFNKISLLASWKPGLSVNTNSGRIENIRENSDFQ